VGRVRLNKEASAILGRARIGLVALRAGRMPLVNPAAFSFVSGSIWMTTSRFAIKTVLARRDPRAAFFVDGGSSAVLVRGTLQVFDPMSISSDIRALLGGPATFLGMADYTLKNAPFIAGYMLDLMRIPREWMPYNRVVLRLNLSEAELIEVGQFPEAHAARVPAVPAAIGRRLAGVNRAYACWLEGGKPVIEPAMWEVDHDQVLVAPVGGRHPRAGAGGALVIESHHPFRPSLMVGASLRGAFEASTSAEDIAERYGISAADVPTTVKMQPERVTSWRGFAITSAVPKSARRLRLAEG
jgi:hypothetical protein